MAGSVFEGVPALQPFSITPALNAYLAGTQERRTQETHTQGLTQNAIETLGRLAVSADTEEKWGQYVDTVQSRYPGIDLSRYRDFSMRDASLAEFEPYFASREDMLGRVRGLGQPGTQPNAVPNAGGNYRDSISAIESGGRYDAVGPTDARLGRPLGKYQVMEANIGPWSQEVLGRTVTPQEFLASPEIQDAIFDAKFGGYVSQYGPEGAAQAWFGGPGSVGQTGRQDVLGTSVGEYGQRFMAGLGIDQSVATSLRGGVPSEAVAQAGAQMGMGADLAELYSIVGAENNGFAQLPATTQGLIIDQINRLQTPTEQPPLVAAGGMLYDRSTNSWIVPPQQPAEPGEPPTEWQLYQLYMRQEFSEGRTPKSHEDWYANRARAGAPSTTIVTPGDRDFIRDAQVQMDAGQRAVSTLQQLLDLNDAGSSFAGPGALVRARVMANTGNQEAINTLEMDNLVTRLALDQLRAIFAANPTEGERKILLEVQGSVNQPPEVRARIWNNAIDAANARIASSQQIANSVRTGELYQPGYTPGGAASPPSAPTVAPPPAAAPAMRPGAAMAAPVVPPPVAAPQAAAPPAPPASGLPPGLDAEAARGAAQRFLANGGSRQQANEILANHFGPSVTLEALGL